MSHHDSGWRPTTVEEYNGFEVYDHGVWANEINAGDVEGEDADDDDE